MTVTEAAAVLGVNDATIRYRIMRGDMKAEKAGPRLWLIPNDEVERWKRLGKMKRGPKPKEQQT